LTQEAQTRRSQTVEIYWSERPSQDLQSQSLEALQPKPGMNITSIMLPTIRN
jgi:hypothetical protein